MAMEGILGGGSVSVAPGLGEGVAVLDLGAGAFRLTVAEVGLRGQIRRGLRQRRPVRMLEPLRTGRLDDASWGVGRGAISALVAEARARPWTNLRGVASSWFGGIANGREFLAEVRTSFGLPIELLSPEDEARLAWSAARAEAPWARGPIAVIAIGASSVHVAVGLGGLCLSATALPLGALRMRARHLGHDGRLDRDAARAIADEVLTVAADAAEQVRSFRPGVVLLAGGNCRALGRCSRALPEWPRPRVLGHDHARGLVALLSGNGPTRMGEHGIAGDRPDELGPAAVVLSTLFAMVEIDEGVIVRAGLAAGLLSRERWDDVRQ